MSKQSYQAYKRYLFLSGGKLALHKCKYYYLTFHRRGNKYVFSLKKPKKMSLCEGFILRRVLVKPKKANEDHKILGMKIDPDGNQREQVKTVVKQVKEWTRNMEMWNILPRLRDLSYRMNLWPALKYPLGVCQLSLADVEAVEKELRPTLKAANYLSSRFSNTIMSLPLKFGGYGG